MKLSGTRVNFQVVCTSINWKQRFCSDQEDDFTKIKKLPKPFYRELLFLKNIYWRLNEKEISIIVFIIICTIELFPQKVGDAYALNINNIYMPLNRKGVLADANVPPVGPYGQFGGMCFSFLVASF